MTVSEAAKHYGVSKSTIYRRIRRGDLPAYKDGRRWVIGEKEMDWNPQIHRQIAEQDGFTPKDFTWLQYPVSNIRLEHNRSRHIDLSFLADLPPDTPQVNVYIEEKDRQEGVKYEDAGAGWLKIPDPVGTALAWVRFDLIDTADGAELHTSSSPSHFDGAIEGGLSATVRGIPLWDRLTPGASIRVQVQACPEFFPWVDENGGGRLGYTTNSNGYFKGETVISPVYTLAMTKDGGLLIDGQPKPTVETPADPNAAEHDALMAREEAERQAAEEALRQQVAEENRLHNERMAQEHLERQEAAQREAEAAARERERQAQEAEQERERASKAAAGVVEYTLLDQMRDGLRDKSDDETADFLVQVLGWGDEEYSEVARAYANERGITLPA